MQNSVSILWDNFTTLYKPIRYNGNMVSVIYKFTSNQNFSFVKALSKYFWEVGILSDDGRNTEFICF